MPNRIAVVCAPNVRYYNTGMLTVDLAAAGFLRRHVPAAQVTWLTLFPPDITGTPLDNSLDPSLLPFRWYSLASAADTLRTSDLILLWGDFQQARHYLVSQVERWQRFYPGTQADPLTEIIRLLLLRDQDAATLRKVLVVGSTLMMNRQSDYADPCYEEALLRLLCGARLVLMRDPLSAAKVANLTGRHHEGFLGADPALLLTTEDSACLPTSVWSTALPAGERAGIFYGARVPIWPGVHEFCCGLARAIGCDPEWFPWLPGTETGPHGQRRLGTRARRALQGLLPGKQTGLTTVVRGDPCSAGDRLAALGKYRLIITDTYHLCVNAWRLGIPAVCLGAPGFRLQGLGTLNDLKKELFYRMYEASDLYVDAGALRYAPRRAAEIDRLTAMLNDPIMLDSIVQRLRLQVQAVGARIAAALN